MRIKNLFLLIGALGAFFIAHAAWAGIYTPSTPASVGGTEISNDGTKTTLLPPTGDYLRVGDAATTNHSLNANDDLYVSGKLEVDGSIYFDNSIRFLDNTGLLWGTSDDSNMFWNISQTPDTLYMGLGSDSNGLLITEKADYSTDFGHSKPTNPTIWLQSADATQTTEYNVLSWNNVSIGGGKGSFFGIKSMTEEVTIAVGQGNPVGVTTSGNLAPANSLIMGIAARITDAPGGGASTVDIGVTGGDLDAFVDGMAVALNTTATTPKDGSAQMPIANGTATTLSLTTDAAVTIDDMKVRVVVYYMEFTAPTS